MEIDSGNTAWVLTAAALVLLMTPGLGFFYGGLVRSKHVLNTLMMSVIAMGIVALEWAILGYSIAFAPGGSLLGGLAHVGLAGVGAAPRDGTTIPHLAFMVFQMMFAVITPALISGAIIGRMRFGAYAVLVLLWSLVVYNPLCHWVWGGGWIAKLGALDFAGGTVVHISAGFSALVAAMMLGPRIGHRQQPHKPHHVPFVMLGAALLWFGWLGFNAGSALAADGVAALALVNTVLGGAGAMATWALLERVRSRKPTAVGAATGAVVGLVSITPGAGFVAPMASIAIGAAGAVASFFAIQAMSRTRHDDSLDVFACHGVGGVVGSVLTGVFATKAVNAAGADGLLYGNPALVLKQLAGALGAVGLAVVATAAIILFLRAVMPVRAKAEDEQGGLDLSEHGEGAYASDAMIGGHRVPPELEAPVPAGGMVLRREQSAATE